MSTSDIRGDERITTVLLDDGSGQWQALLDRARWIASSVVVVSTPAARGSEELVRGGQLGSPATAETAGSAAAGGGGVAGAAHVTNRSGLGRLEGAMAVNRAPVPIIQDRTASTAEVRWQTTGQVYGEE